MPAFRRAHLSPTVAHALTDMCVVPVHDRYPYKMALASGGPALHFNRREEPKLLIDRQSGRPLALFNVVDDNFLYNQSRIIVQELDWS